jgi:hypothetical protein
MIVNNVKVGAVPTVAGAPAYGFPVAGLVTSAGVALWISKTLSQ